MTQTFGTMTADLLALRDWLQAYGVTHVALESTGVYWKPVYYVLEDDGHAAADQHAGTEAGPRPEDRREGQRVAGAVAGMRVVEGQFRAAARRFGKLRDLTRYRVQQARIGARRSIGSARCWKMPG